MVENNTIVPFRGTIPKGNKKGKIDSYLVNNLVMPRGAQVGTMFESILPMANDGDSGNVICRLNGYAIIPIEEYLELKGKKVDSELMKKIAQFDNSASSGSLTPGGAILAYSKSTGETK